LLEHISPFYLHSGGTVVKLHTIEAAAMIRARVKKVLTLLIFNRMG